MPTVNVDKQELYEILGKTYSKLIFVLYIYRS